MLVIRKEGQISINTDTISVKMVSNKMKGKFNPMGRDAMK